MEENKSIRNFFNKLKVNIRSWRYFLLYKLWRFLKRALQTILCYWIMPALTIVFIWLMFKSSNEPMLDSLFGTPFESLFIKFPLGNSIIFDLSLAFLASVIFFIINIWIPQTFKRSYMRRHLHNQLNYFKKRCLEVFFDAMEIHHDYELINRLTCEKVFKEYFDQPSTKYNGNLWCDIINNFDEEKYVEILHAFESFAAEINLILGQIEILDDEVFNGLRWIQIFATDLRAMIDKEELIGWDNEKYVFRELREIFTGWDFIEGQKKISFITKVVKKI
jgi:hypothetical protein